MQPLPLSRSRTGRRAVLALTAELARPFISPGRRPRATDRLLLVRPDHLGDLLFTTPALRHLRERWPEAKITYLVGPWAAPVAARNPHVDDVLYYPFPWFSGQPRSTPWQPYLQLLSLARRLRARQFAAAVNLRFDFWWGAALLHLAGIPYRLGYSTPDCRPFLSSALPYRPGRHEVMQNFALADHLTARPGPDAGGQDDSRSIGPLDFPVTPEERAFAEGYLRGKGIAKDRPLLVIHPGTRALAKRWTEDGFAAVASALAGRLGGVVMLTGSASERALAERIANNPAIPAIVAAGETTLGQLAALFERATLIIGVDSGPMHLAVALDRRTVQLYGPSDHRAFAPYGDPSRHAIVRAGLDCSPCHRLDWPENQRRAHPCMAAITAVQVLRAADRVLEGACLQET